MPVLDTNKNVNTRNDLVGATGGRPYTDIKIRKHPTHGIIVLTDQAAVGRPAQNAGLRPHMRFPKRAEEQGPREKKNVPFPPYRKINSLSPVAISLRAGRRQRLYPLLLVQPGFGSFPVEEGLDRESGLRRYSVHLKFGERLSGI